MKNRGIEQKIHKKRKNIKKPEKVKMQKRKRDIEGAVRADDGGALLEKVAQRTVAKQRELLATRVAQLDKRQGEHEAKEELFPSHCPRASTKQGVGVWGVRRGGEE